MNFIQDLVDTPVAHLETMAQVRFLEKPKKTAAMAEREVQMMMMILRP